MAQCTYCIHQSSLTYDITTTEDSVDSLFTANVVCAIQCTMYMPCDNTNDAKDCTQLDNDTICRCCAKYAYSDDKWSSAGADVENIVSGNGKAISIGEHNKTKLFGLDSIV